MSQNDSKKQRKDKFVVVGGAWLWRKGGTGTQYFKMTVTINNKPVSLTGWPNQKKFRQDQPDFLLYAVQKPAE